MGARYGSFALSFAAQWSSVLAQCGCRVRHGVIFTPFITLVIVLMHLPIFPVARGYDGTGPE